MAKIYSKTELVQILQDLEKTLGRTPTPQDLTGDLSAQNVLGYFKKWDRALKAAGIKKICVKSAPVVKEVQAEKIAEPAPAPVVKEVITEEPCGARRYSKAIITKMLQDECARLGKKPTRKEIDENKDLPTVATILKYFDTTKIGDVWNEVLK